MTSCVSVRIFLRSKPTIVSVHARAIELSMQIERQHLEISEMLRKLLELDAANRAEAAALVRLAEDSATSPGTSGPGASRRAGDVGGQAGPDATTSSGGEDGTGTGSSSGGPGVKRRRSALSRAVSAIRKKFARTSQPEAVPAAA